MRVACDFSRVPHWLLQALHVNPEPRKPRCKRYELDITKPKAWQFFETFYDETSHHTIPRLLPNWAQSRPRNSKKMSPFARFLVDLFMLVVDPVQTVTQSDTKRFLSSLRLR